MDLIVPIIILILLFITCSVCGYCCKRNKQGIVYGTAQPIATTTTTSQYQATPYPVMETPMPQPGPPGFAPHAAYPPTTPYPPATGFGHMSMPMPMAGNFPTSAPYPAMPMPPGPFNAPVPAYPVSTAAAQMPPSYAEATARTNEGYAQQSPYNPNFN